jgi:type IV pilus assembly protein PilW
MNSQYNAQNDRRGSHRLCCQRGFTLVELMVTVAIALFLLGGLVTIVQNVRQANLDQQSLAQLQDEQRFAMTVLTDVIQAGGYFPDPTAWTPTTSLPAWGPFPQGQAFIGTHAAGVPDTLGVRYRTGGGDGVILCDGSTNTGAVGTSQAYANQFTVVPPAGNVPGRLFCQRDANAAVAIVNGVQNLTVYYGVKRNFALNDYNVDTYLTADQMLNTDWANINSVRIVLVFTNPLFKAGCPACQPATITFERVVNVMARTGVHT